MGNPPEKLDGCCFFTYVLIIHLIIWEILHSRLQHGLIWLSKVHGRASPKERCIKVDKVPYTSSWKRLHLSFSYSRSPPLSYNLQVTQWFWKNITIHSSVYYIMPFFLGMALFERSPLTFCTSLLWDYSRSHGMSRSQQVHEVHVSQPSSKH